MALRHLSAGAAALLSLYLGNQVFSQGQSKLAVNDTLVVSDPGVWKTLRRGLEYRKMIMQRSDPPQDLGLTVVRVQTPYAYPRVLHSQQLQLKSASAKMFAEKTGAVAAINANYFDERGRPLAYLKTAQNEINASVSKHGLYTGIFGLSHAGPFVTHRDEFSPDQAAEALQSGPLLLHRGEPVPVVSGLGRQARRSVIAIDKHGSLIIGVVDAVLGGLSFAELQALFSGAKWQIDATELLNLDGGGSAQLYIKAANFEQWLPGTSEVPVAIGIFLK